MEHFHWGIEGWTTDEQDKLYQYMVRQAKNGAHFVEVGCWKGRSTSILAVEIHNSGKSIKFDAIDNFQGSIEHSDNLSIKNSTLYEEFSKNTEPVKHIVNTIVADSSHAASFYSDNSLDFVFLDADHSYEGLTKDIHAWLPKIKPGGILAGDDFSNNFPGVIQSVIENIGDVNVTGCVWMYEKPVAVDKHYIQGDEYYNSTHSYDKHVETAYIISLKNEDGKPSEQVKRCIESCDFVGMKYELFDAFDGTDNKTIKTPEHMRNKDYMSWIKIVDEGLTAREIGCAMSHIALWAHCITIDKPIVILEHDAIMLKKYTNIPFLNSVDYLGNITFANAMVETFDDIDNFGQIPLKLKQTEFHTTAEDLPIMAATSENYFYMNGAHAYAIDPLAAKKLLTKVIMDGLRNPNDTLVSARDITLACSGLYAMEGPDAFLNSTIMPAMYEVGQDVSNYRLRKSTYIIPSLTRK